MNPPLLVTGKVIAAVIVKAVPDVLALGSMMMDPPLVPIANEAKVWLTAELAFPFTSKLPPEMVKGSAGAKMLVRLPAEKSSFHEPPLMTEALVKVLAAIGAKVSVPAPILVIPTRAGVAGLT